MKTNIDSIVDDVNSKNLHKDVFDRIIHPGDVVVVLDNSFSTKSSMKLDIGIAEKTDSKYLKVIDYKTFFTNERKYLPTRSLVGKMCCIVNNEIPQYDLDNIKKTFAEPFKQFYPYIFAYKLTDEFYCLQLVMSKDCGSKETLDEAINELYDSSDYNSFSFKNKQIKDLHILMQDLSFVNVANIVDYKKINNNFITPSKKKSSRSNCFINDGSLLRNINDNEDYLVYRFNYWSNPNYGVVIPIALSTVAHKKGRCLRLIDSKKEMAVYTSFINFVRQKNENKSR